MGQCLGDLRMWRPETHVSRRGSYSSLETCLRSQKPWVDSKSCLCLCWPMSAFRKQAVHAWPSTCRNQGTWERPVQPCNQDHAQGVHWGVGCRERLVLCGHFRYNMNWEWLSCVDGRCTVVLANLQDGRGRAAASYKRSCLSVQQEWQDYRTVLKYWIHLILAKYWGFLENRDDGGPSVCLWCYILLKTHKNPKAKKQVLVWLVTACCPSSNTAYKYSTVFALNGTSSENKSQSNARKEARRN